MTAGDCLYTTTLAVVDRYDSGEPPTWKNTITLPEALVPNPVSSVTPEPDGIACAFDNTGVWVTDFAQSRVVKVKGDGTYLAQFGELGTGPGQFGYNPGPEGIAINPNDGRIYVCDRGNQRVQYFDQFGNYLGQWGGSFAPGGFGWVQQHPVPNTPFDIPPMTEIDAPGEIRNHGMAYDEIRNVSVLAGGRVSDFSANVKTWLYDSTADVWTDPSPAHYPFFNLTNCNVTMCWDGNTGTVILLMPGPAMWSFDGTDWTQLTPANMPSDGHTNWEPGTIAWDRANNQVVYFGGRDSITGLLAETWLWDGTNWTFVTPTHHPGGSAQDNVVMTFDESSGYILMFGGPPGGDGTSQETWKWDGTDWTHLTPATIPLARAGHMMAYHLGFGKLIMGQGTSNVGIGNQAYTDTWEWTGADWLDLVLPGPSLGGGRTFIPRAYAPMVADRSTQVTVTYGGDSTITFPAMYGDTWEVVYTAPTGDFDDPAGIAIDPGDGSVYVGDYTLNEVQKFTATGTPILSFGSGGTGDGQFDRPSGIAVDGSGHVWVNDPQPSGSPPGRIQEFTSAGVFIQKLTFVFAFSLSLFGLAIKPSTGRLYSVAAAFGDASIWDPVTGYTGTAVPSHSGGMAQCCFGPCTLGGHPIFNNEMRVENK